MSPDRSECYIGIFTTDADLVVRSWDKWLERVTGFGAGEVCGKPLRELFPEVEERGLLERFRSVIDQGTVAVLAPAFHHYLIPVKPQAPSRHFEHMQQRVTIAPLKEQDRTVGTIVTIEDVTPRLDREREAAVELSSPDEHVRLQAVAALAAGEGEEGLRPLVDTLGDANWRVRGEAVKGLARRGGPEAVGELLKALRLEHHNLSVLNSALQVLSMIHLDTLTPLVEFLTDPDTELRIYAALALGEMRDAHAVPHLIAALQDPDVNVRYHAIEALGKLRAGEAVEPLCTVAESRDFFLAFPALDALVRIGDPTVAPRIVPLLEDELLREPAAHALGHLGDQDVVAPLAAQLNAAHPPAGMVTIIAGALANLCDRYEKLYGEGSHIADLARGSIDAPGVRNLIAALDEVDEKGLRPVALVLGWLEGAEAERAMVRLLSLPTARPEVVEALVRYGKRVFASLVQQLRSEDSETRQAAAVALGRIGDPRAVPELIDLMQRDESLVIPAAGALAKIGDRRAMEALLRLLGHSGTGVRQAAVSALNSLGHPEMVFRVAALLKDSDPLLRESAVKIAGYFGYPECRDLLFERCSDPDEAVRSAAVENVAYLEDPRVVPLLCEVLRSDTPRVRAAAARAFSLVETGEALPCLLSGMNDPDSWVRYFAARSLAKWEIERFSDTDVPNVMFEALARLVGTDPAPQVRIAAMEALCAIGGTASVDLLSAQAERKNRDIARAALCALGRIPGQASLKPILAALHSGDQVRRLDAIHALRECREAGSVGALEWASTDRDPAVSRAAIEALAHLKTSEAIRALSAMTADESRREAAIDVLSHLGADRIDRIAKGLVHDSPEVRRSIVLALARMKHSRATDRLAEALEDSVAAVRLAAVNSLKQLGSRRAEARLVEIARSDPDLAVRHAARSALSYLGL